MFGNVRKPSTSRRDRARGDGRGERLDRGFFLFGILIPEEYAICSSSDQLLLLLFLLLLLLSVIRGRSTAAL
jgi:hypothetical protein